MKRFFLVLLAWLFLVQPLPAGRAQSAIALTDLSAESHFPDQLIFTAKASSMGGQIEAAHLLIRLHNAVTAEQEEVPLTPANEVQLSYRWDTRNHEIPPFAPLEYTWVVSDSAGDRQSLTGETLYNDTRYEWRKLQAGELTVWEHDQPGELAQAVIAVAEQARPHLETLYGTRRQQPVQIVLYNSFREFSSWQAGLGDFYAGEAFPDLGLTVQVVTTGQNQQRWLNGVVPHELAHLYYYQVSHNPSTELPNWVNEGLAQYSELNDPQVSLDLARRSVLSGLYIPLTELDGGFGNNNEEWVSRAYAESLSMVTYLVETYGQDGITRLLSANRQGQKNPAAFRGAFGRSLTELEQDWLAWLGAAPGIYVTPGFNDWVTPLPPPQNRWPDAPGNGLQSSSSTTRLMTAVGILASGGACLGWVALLAVAAIYLRRRRHADEETGDESLETPDPPDGGPVEMP